MSERPEGIVAFLFTDIEGSTRLWERNARAMRAAVARHDATLAAAIAAEGGVLFKHIGDAVQAAFPSASGALAAAVAAQRALAAASWAETGPLRVRMAIHIGEAVPTVTGDYHQAPCLNRLARLLAAGHGGQILLSTAARGAIGDRLPEGVTPTDLGRHRLRDLLESDVISQATVAGLPHRFPPLKTLEGFPTNLPSQPNVIIGRERELAAIAGLLADERRRLLTLTGPGGVGKTRLALQAAADLLDGFPDGVFSIELGQMTDPALVLPTIASTLGVRDPGGTDLDAALAERIGTQRMLLALDNLEQLSGCAPRLAALLAACPDLRIIATSRIPLRIAAEQLLDVTPLVLPARDADAERVVEVPAVRLFLERARARLPGFDPCAGDLAAIATLCRRLDGLPLALELAAAALRYATVAELLAGLDRRFALPADGDPARLTHQRALETTIAWSYDRLTESPQRLMRQAAIFAGGWATEAGRAVVADPDEIATGLAALLDASLIRRETIDGVSRWSMLESIRAFALERLERSGEAAGVRRRHAEWCLALAREADAAHHGPEQERWLIRLEREHDNLRAALGWAAADDDAIVLPLAGALWRFWRVRGHFTKGRRWLDEALRCEVDDPPARADALLGAGALAREQGDLATAERHWRAALEPVRAIGDRGREAALLNNLGTAALERGDLAGAETRFTESLALARTLGDRRRAGDALANLGALAHYRGDTRLALERYRESLAVAREMGDRSATADTLLNLLLLLAPFPEHGERAGVWGEECLRAFRVLGDRQGEGLALTGLGLLAAARDDLAEAADRHERALALFEEIDDRSGVGRALGNLGLVALARGERTRAADLLRDALRRNLETGEQAGAAAALAGLAAATADADPPLAAAMLGAADGMWDEMGMPEPPELRQPLTAARAALHAALGAGYDAALVAGRDRSPASLLAASSLAAAPGSQSDADSVWLAGVDDLLQEWDGD
ncbi:MAG: tetratricopeptide repeat protein [Thermomicrobiales bacterium]|nr:tetratricopeptide repeat protein [Thermomicrobiales bacterium]